MHGIFLLISNKSFIKKTWSRYIKLGMGEEGNQGWMKQRAKPKPPKRARAQTPKGARPKAQKQPMERFLIDYIVWISKRWHYLSIHEIFWIWGLYESLFCWDNVFIILPNEGLCTEYPFYHHTFFFFF